MSGPERSEQIRILRVACTFVDVYLNYNINNLSNTLLTNKINIKVIYIIYNLSSNSNY